MPVFSTRLSCVLIVAPIAIAAGLLTGCSGKNTDTDDFLAIRRVEELTSRI